jgi:hypothetical protein
MQICALVKERGGDPAGNSGVGVHIVGRFSDKRYRAIVLSSISPSCQWLALGVSGSLRSGNISSGAGMRRLVRWGLFALLTCAGLTACASATTYYIAANGSDSNNGTSKSTPWQHAPGMTGCSGTCASTTPQPGDSFIFRGGDTWHFGNSGLSPYVGGNSPHWNWNWAGSSGGCQLDGSAGAIAKTSCIYIGVDQSWSSGGSWSRPIMSGDNSAQTGYVGSCAFDQSSQNFFFINQPYVIQDNFEWTGWCWTGTNGAVITFLTSYGEATNNYFHGWTLGSSATDQFRMITCNGTGCSNSSFILVDHNVFDGSDASLGATPGKASGFALGAGYEIAYNVFWHISNGYIGGSAPGIHDNLFYYLMEPSDATHGNIIEQQGAPAQGTFFYNNLMFVTNEGEGINIYTSPGNPAFVFNNISYLYRATFSGTTAVNSNDGTNCFLPENTGSSGPRTFYFFNNTFDNPCAVSPKNISLTQIFENNHLIGYSPAALSTLAQPAITDNGSEIYQTESAANAQGYTTSNNYAPTASNDATVGAGTNVATSICNTMPYALAAAACTQSYGGVTYNQSGHTAVQGTPTARPSGGWDVGAYQFGAGSTSGPNPPTGLTATVQ